MPHVQVRLKLWKDHASEIRTILYVCQTQTISSKRTSLHEQLSRRCLHTLHS